MHAEVAVSTPLRAKPSRWLAGPPGILFYLATACACLFALDANSRGSLVGLLIVAPVWLVIAGVWLVRFVAAATDAGWRFTGYVEDIRPHTSGASAFVIPLRVGGGTRIKAFEATALGCPVVSTTIGVEGLPLKPGEHYLRADSAREMADAVVSLLTQRDLRQRMAREARAYTEANFSFRVAAKTFENICLRAARLV